MNIWAKVFLGFLAVLLLICIGGGLAFHFSGGTEVVKDFTQGISGIQSSNEKVEKLNREMPFEPPEDGRVPEERLQAYLEICKEVKPVADSYDEWMQAHQGNQGDFGDAREAITMTADIFRVYGVALESNRMSPREFTWIYNTMKKAYREAASKSGAPLQREMLLALEKAARNPKLTRAERSDLDARIQDFRERIGELPGGKLSPNAELYTRHMEKLEEYKLSEFGVMIMSGQGQRHSSGNIHIDVSE
jgi:hypothetical protein